MQNMHNNMQINMQKYVMLYEQYAQYAIQFNMQNMQINRQTNMHQYADFDVFVVNCRQYAKYAI